jgi:hypothetical protein
MKNPKIFPLIWPGSHSLGKIISIAAKFKVKPGFRVAALSSGEGLVLIIKMSK